MARQGGPAYPDLDRLARSLKSDVFVRIAKKAQVTVLNRWVTRTRFPGLAFRFEPGAVGAYGWHGYRAGERPYYKTGSTRAMLLNRRAKGRRASKGVARAVVLTGGGYFNVLRNKYPAEVRKTTSVRPVFYPETQVREHVRHRHGRSELIEAYTLPARQANREVTETFIVRHGESYTEQFQDFSLDKPWIQREIDKEFKKELKRVAFTSKGKLKKSFAEAM